MLKQVRHSEHLNNQTSPLSWLRVGVLNRTKIRTKKQLEDKKRNEEKAKKEKVQKEKGESRIQLKEVAIKYDEKNKNR